MADAVPCLRPDRGQLGCRGSSRDIPRGSQGCVRPPQARFVLNNDRSSSLAFAAPPPDLLPSPAGPPGAFHHHPSHQLAAKIILHSLRGAFEAPALALDRPKSILLSWDCPLRRLASDNPCAVHSQPLLPLPKQVLALPSVEPYHRLVPVPSTWFGHHDGLLRAQGFGHIAVRCRTRFAAFHLDHRPPGKPGYFRSVASNSIE